MLLDNQKCLDTNAYNPYLQMYMPPIPKCFQNCQKKL